LLIAEVSGAGAGSTSLSVVAATCPGVMVVVVVIVIVEGWGPVLLFLVLFSVLLVLLDPPCEGDNLNKNKMRMLVG
jgi:hypothetical protein